MSIKHFRNHLLPVMMVTIVGSMLLTINTKAASFASSSAVEVAVEKKDQAVIEKENKAFEENTAAAIKDLFDNGIVVDQSMTKGNLTVHFEKILTDQYCYRILCSIEKVDQTPFDNPDKLVIEDFFCDSKKAVENDKDGKFRESVGSQSVQMCEAPYSTDKKIYFFIEGSQCQERLANEIELNLTEISSFVNHEYTTNFDLAAYLSEHKETPELVDNPQKKRQKERLEKIKDKQSEEYKEEKQHYDQMADKILGQGNLNIALINENDDLKIDNIGFVDGQLHIISLSTLTKNNNSSYHMSLVDTDGKNVNISSMGGTKEVNGNRVKSRYDIYDVGTIDQLNGMKLKIKQTNREIIAEGPWTANVKVAEEKKVTKTINQQINGSDNSKVNLKEVVVTPLAVRVTLDGIKQGVNKHNSVVDVTMKDGKVYQLQEMISEKKGANEQLIVFGVPGAQIIPEDVASVTIGGQVVQF